MAAGGPWIPIVVVEDDIAGFPQWRVVFMFMVVDGRVRLAETTVMPAAERRRYWAEHPTESAREVMNQPSPLLGAWDDPGVLRDLGDGVPARAYRNIRSLGAMSDVVRLLRGRVVNGSISVESDEYTKAQSFDDLPVAAEPSQDVVRTEGEAPRSAGRSDHFYAVWASRYLEAFRELPRSPAVALSRRFGISQKQAHYLVLKARKRSLLLGGQQGRPGGRLSPKAERLLGISANNEEDSP